MLFESASVKDGAIKAFLSLFPAHAGVILGAVIAASELDAFPRARGGDPAFECSRALEMAFSPRTRG